MLNESEQHFREAVKSWIDEPTTKTHVAGDRSEHLNEQRTQNSTHLGWC